MDAQDIPPPPGAAPDARVLAASLVRALRAWHTLLQAEIDNARQSLRALAIGALIAPVLLLGLWFSALALLLIALQAAGLGWLGAAALTCALQIGLLWLLFRSVRRWARELSLPRSRAILLQLTEPNA